ncbi:SusD family protein [Mucilaginibacter pineti]|uniref:SusD family protein n=1 Tax=Mucilaginibacter pineti TaxID=1391627 RepID=A0A1G7P3N6_9SPHI|nr:RagB/SusD family nutrient uptake outer membrane protein [Mucilaginibacter pineti]SDF80905.1 SusD family protein [Mucilaginibacter pineti]
MKTIYKIIITGFLLIVSSCTKEYLDKKPNKALLVPTTLTDFQALLDNTGVMNVVPAIQRIAADYYYTTNAGLIAYANPFEQNSYLWAKDVYQGASMSDWNIPYQQVFYANIALDGLNDIKPDASTQIDYNRVKGSALFYRAIAFYHLAQLFCKPYNPATASQDLGIPISLSSDVNVRPGRGTVQKTYNQIITDLTAAASLLPVTATLKSRPSRPAALALLARAYQTMLNYDQALSYASQCLQLKNSLLDYNTLSTTSSSPFPASLPNGNDEVLFHSITLSYSFAKSALTGIDTLLYRSFSANDLRKSLFFNAPNVNNMIRAKNSYAGTAGTFAGIALDEIYLIKAECYARKGDINNSMNDLNILLAKRYKAGTFASLTASSADDALAKILVERRKELLTNVGLLRWTDLRRLNQEPRFAVTLNRIINGQVYTLPPNDPRYVFPIPDDEIAGSGIEQNIR